MALFGSSIRIIHFSLQLLKKYPEVIIHWIHQIVRNNYDQLFVAMEPTGQDCVWCARYEI
jgi:hypothetical protein